MLKIPCFRSWLRMGKTAGGGVGSRARRRGAALIMVTIGAMLLLVVAAGIIGVTTAQTRNRTRYETYKDEYSAAEEASNKAFAQIQYLIHQQNPTLLAQIAAITPPTVKNIQYTNFKVAQITDATQLLTTGRWKGMTFHTIEYQIDVTAKRTDGAATGFNHTGATLREVIIVTYVPLYIFSIFYDPVMEVAPSPVMTVNGFVHCNGDAYIACANSLVFQKNVTCAGSVYHNVYTTGKTLDAGTVSFTDLKTGAAVLMKSGNSWLDHRSSDWTTAAQDRWNGGLLDSSQGIMPLSLPLPSDVPPHSIIERANSSTDNDALKKEKFENKASLKIYIDSQGKWTAKDADGNAVSVYYPNPAYPTDLTKRKCIITTSTLTTDSKGKTVTTDLTFYDGREQKTVASVDINLINMVESGIKPQNGILYVATADRGTMPGVVRLINGAKLPTSASVTGFTVATEDPLYIQGDYNTTNKCLALVACDALKILSNAWTDSNNKTANMKTASNTTVNAVCMQGNVPTVGTHYSGGVENYFRFLEDWSGKTFTFNGSMILMWKSITAIASWDGQSTGYYSPPNRTWAWDAALGGANGPPGMPPVLTVDRESWSLPEVTK